MDIDAWLKDLGLEQYKAVFRDNAIDAEVLSDLTADDLKDMGIDAVGHRRKILSAIARLGEPAPAPPPPKIVGERRQVTVLFADLVGYTRLTEALGAEAMHGLLDRFFTAVDAIVEATGGRVDKHIGDCVMAVFGAPVAHGDDAARAVSAALQIRETVRAMTSAESGPLETHIGVTTGQVVASLVGSGAAAEYAVTGESVNLASRLSDEAAPGEILISDGLYRALDRRLRCEPAGQLLVKGFSEAVAAWRLLGLSEDRGARGPFVGRQAELGQFASLLQVTAQSRAGHVLLLRGEAGIGKTRLGEEFERLAQAAGFSCHRGLVLDFGMERGRDAVRSIVRELLGAQAGVQDQAALVSRTLASGVVAADHEVFLNDLLDIAQPDRLRALYDAMDREHQESGRGATIAEIVIWAAEARPRLLIVEDAHWAKAPLLRAIAHMAEAVGGCPAILLISSRLEGDPLGQAWRRGIAGTPFTTIDLSPLRQAEARELCKETLGESAAVDAVLARAEGNPLFLEQLLRHSQEGRDNSVPGTIQSLVQARLDQLATVDKMAIQAASAVGQRVDPDLLAALAPDGRFEAATLIEKNLLRPAGDELLFVHALIRDAIYGTLLGERRRELHRRAAEWFRDRDLRLHAEHLGQAGDEGAAAAFLAAATEDVAKYRYETALGLIDRGLALSAPPEVRVALQLLRAQTLHDLGHMAEAAEGFSEAKENAVTQTDRCAALIGLAGVKRVIEDVDGALLDLEEALAIAESEDQLAAQARCHGLRGNLLFPRGDIEGCLGAHERALACARAAKRPDLEAAALGGLGDGEYVRGRMASARKALETCCALAKAAGLKRIEVANQAQVAHTLIYTGPLDATPEICRQAVESAHEVGHSRAELNAGAALLNATIVLKRYDEAIQTAKWLEVGVERLGARRFQHHVNAHTVRALQGLGRKQQALELCETGLAVSRAEGFAFYGPATASVYATIVESADRKVALMQEALDGIAAGCVGHNQLWVYPDGMDVAYSLRDKAMLQDFVEKMDAYPSGERLPWCDLHVLRGEALLSRLKSGARETTAAVRALNDRVEALKAYHWALP